MNWMDERMFGWHLKASKSRMTSLTNDTRKESTKQIKFVMSRIMQLQARPLYKWP
jgi:hypothetical protein